MFFNFLNELFFFRKLTTNQCARWAEIKQMFLIVMRGLILMYLNEQKTEWPHNDYTHKTCYFPFQRVTGQEH